MRRPKWKQRQLAERAEREAAEKKAREDAFWRAVPEPKWTRPKPGGSREAPGWGAIG